MRIFKSKLFLFVFFLFLIGCDQKQNRQTISQEGGDSVAIVSADSSNTTIVLLYIDTIYPLQVNEVDYQLIVSHEEDLSSTNGVNSTTTIRIVQLESHDTLFKKTFDFNTVGRFENPSPNHYLIDLYNSGGGSGYSGTIFNISFTPVITLLTVTNFNELTFWKSNKSGSEILLFQGIWNMGNPENEAEFESHFSEHQQSILVCKIQNDTTLITEIGLTKNKYDVFENANTLREFQEKEPRIARKINWEDYE